MSTEEAKKNWMMLLTVDDDVEVSVTKDQFEAAKLARELNVDLDYHLSNVASCLEDMTGYGPLSWPDRGLDMAESLIRRLREAGDAWLRNDLDRAASLSKQIEAGVGELEALEPDPSGKGTS